MTSDEQTTIIGAQTTIKGDLEAEGDLTLLGRVEGSVKLGGQLIVEAGGVVLASIEASEASLNGTVVGNIIARGPVRLGEQSRVVGDITCSRIALADGAAFRGAIEMAEAGTPSRLANAPRPLAASLRTQAQNPVAEPASPVRPSRATPPRIERKAKAAPASPPVSSEARPVAKSSGARGGRSKVAAAKSRSPRPPTTAGKKSRVKRK